MNILTHLHYTVRGIVKKPVLAAIVFLQITVSLYFLDTALIRKQLFDMETVKYQRLFSGQTYYVLRDKSEEIELFTYRLSGTDSLSRLNQFYQFLTSNDQFVFASFTPTSIFVKNHIYSILPASEGELFKINGFYIDYDYYSIFENGLGVIQGRRLVEEDFGNRNTVPVLLGWAYREIYQIGDIITAYRNRFDEVILEVIGFLQPGSFLINNLFDMVILDSMFVAPLSGNLISNFRIGEYDMLIFSSILITETPKQALQAIQDKSRELSLYMLEIHDSNDGFQNRMELVNQSIKYYYLLFYLVLGFSTIGITLSILNSIDMKSMEFGVHMLCGASTRDFIIRIVLELGIIIFGSLGIVLSLRTTWIGIHTLFLFSLLVLIVLVIMPVIKLHRLDVVSLLGR